MQEMKNVTKRDGSVEPLCVEKVHQVLEWAVDGLTNVSVSDIEMNSALQFSDGMATDKIHSILIKSAADLISEQHPNYQYVAARLVLFDLTKKVHGSINHLSIRDIVASNTARGLYDSEILSLYSEDEIDQLDSIIDHKRDYTLTYAGIMQFVNKYSVQDRVNKIPYETPQVSYLLISAILFAKYPAETRMSYVKDFYDAASNYDFSLPTPIMAGLRTPQKQFASCVLIESGDSIDTITATSGSIVKFISSKAGVGIGAGRIRALGDSIRAGDAYHTGVTPFFKLFESSVKSVNQGGVRSAAATLNTMIWHKEIEDILVLKNNKGTDDNRVRRIDYCIQVNKLFYSRLIKNEDISLFSPHDVPGLYDAFFADQTEFARLYTKYEADKSIDRKVISAKELFSLLATERAETGRIYISNVDHVNSHGSFDTVLATVFMTNLCVEVTLPTVPLKFINDPDGEIALCILAAVNIANMKTEQHLKRVVDLCVRALDELIDYQSYMIPAAAKMKKRRSIGIGFTNMAYYLAKNDIKYSDCSALDKVNQLTEMFQYFAIQSSVNLAKEKGPCELFHHTKYSKGILPIDTYEKNVDELVAPDLIQDWETLRDEILEHGMRNSTLTAMMPCESSSLPLNATNGLEPPRSLISIKQNKDGLLKQVVPDIRHCKNKYELLWDMPSPVGYIKTTAVIQKYIDQAISVNISYNPRNYPNGEIPMSTVLKDILTCYKYGHKNLYYHNTRDGREDSVEDSTAPETGCGDTCSI